MTGEVLHRLLIDMDFVEVSPGPHEAGREYHHTKHRITFRPVAGLELTGLADALVNGGMARQKLETLEVIREAGKKLGFKF